MQSLQTQHAKALTELGIYNTQHQANLIIQSILDLAKELSINYPQYGFENHSDGFYALLECKSNLETVCSMVDNPNYKLAIGDLQ
jgi:hypothetical protein